jgi:hypothetical protein
MIWFQNFILQCLHHNTFWSTLSNMIFEAHYAQILSCSNPRASAWLTIQPIFPSIQLTSMVFSIVLWIQPGVPHPSITNILWCVCTHPIDLMGMHVLCCVHGNERITTHGIVHNTFATIAQDVGFHVGWKQLHVLLLIMFNSSHQRIDIVLTKDNIPTLVDIVIVYPTRTDYFPNLAPFKDLLLPM